MHTKMSPGEKIVTGLALAVVLAGFATGAPTLRAAPAHGSPPLGEALTSRFSSLATHGMGTGCLGPQPLHLAPWLRRCQVTDVRALEHPPHG
jgi:hypothetical protein